MELRVERKWFTRQSSIGRLLIDGVGFCYTLEDTTRPDGVKIAGRTAIPVGRYRVVLDYSQRFQRVMPHVLDVPNFAGIRIHAGNSAADTEGCLLLGCSYGADAVYQSRQAFAPLMRLLLENVWREHECWITYVNDPAADSPMQPPITKLADHEILGK